MSRRPETPRTVKPREPFTGHLPILAVGPDRVLVESTGEIHHRDDLADILFDHPSAMVVCSNPERLTGELHRKLTDHPRWQFRLTPIIRERKTGDGTVKRREELIVNFFGFRRPNGKKRNRYFYPIAPGQFCRRSIRDLVPDKDLPFHHALLRWGEAVRAFCEANDLRPSPTGGGIAAQLLRHPTFYNNARRKVPTATNEQARPHLPGNYYELQAHTDRIYGGAIYIDQANAHHFAASTVDVPHADRLYARGRFHTLESAPWIRPGGPGWDALRRTHGLLFARVEIPAHIAGGRFIPPYLSIPGERDVWIYTNELVELEHLRVPIRWVSAAWTSQRADVGVKRYANWSMEQVAQAGDNTPWLKPTLLAAYGILAAKPRHLITAFNQADKGEEERWTLGAELVDVKVRRTKKKLQTPIANTIQRGMIEAETRRLSLGLARDLEQHHGREVFAVYADAVIVRDDRRDTRTLPMLPEPWRIKERLSRLHFHTPQAFESIEIRRLPGVPRKGKVSVSA